MTVKFPGLLPSGNQLDLEVEFVCCHCNRVFYFVNESNEVTTNVDLVAGEAATIWLQEDD